MRGKETIMNIAAAKAFVKTNKRIIIVFGISLAAAIALEYADDRAKEKTDAEIEEAVAIANATDSTE